MMIKHKRIIAHLLIFLPILMLLVFPSKADAGNKEYQLKAAFLVQFAKYTKWPNIRGEQIVVGIIGEDPFGDTLDRYNGKILQGKTLVIKKIDNTSEAKTCCQLIYISVSERERMDEVINPLAGEPILTVSDIDGFTQRGGMIHLVRKGTKQKFVVNINNANKASLDFSSRMLSVAISVVR